MSRSRRVGYWRTGKPRGDRPGSPVFLNAVESATFEIIEEGVFTGTDVGDGSAFFEFQHFNDGAANLVRCEELSHFKISFRAGVFFETGEFPPIQTVKTAPSGVALVNEIGFFGVKLNDEDISSRIRV